MLADKDDLVDMLTTQWFARRSLTMQYADLYNKHDTLRCMLADFVRLTSELAARYGASGAESKGKLFTEVKPELKLIIEGEDRPGIIPRSAEKIAKDFCEKYSGLPSESAVRKFVYEYRKQLDAQKRTARRQHQAAKQALGDASVLAAEFGFSLREIDDAAMMALSQSVADDSEDEAEEWLAAEVAKLQRRASKRYTK